MISALERCVEDVGAFVRDAWARHPVLRAAAPGQGFEDLMTLADVDHMLSTMSLRLPTFRLVRGGATLPAETYTRSGRSGSRPMSGIADPARIFRLFDQGATIVLQGVHRYWLPMSRFCRELEMELGHPTQVNAYITPSGSRGLAVHEDSHDVFVLQAFGRKHWEVWGTGADANGSAPVISTELTPGDALYMPKGTPHAARTQETLSGHLTVGVQTVTWRTLFERELPRLTETSDLDDPLPAGYHANPAAFASEIEARLADVQRRLEKAVAADIAARAIDRFLTSRPSLLDGTLADLLRVGEVHDGSLVRRRPATICELRASKGRLRVLLGDRELAMPLAAGDAMRFLASRDELRVEELAPFLDASGRLVLVRRLVKEGLLEIAPHDRE